MKKKVSILLVCAGGNSTSILVANMQKDLKEDENWFIEASSVNDLATKIGKYDYILVAPQVKFLLEDIRGMAEQIGGIGVYEIEPDDYAKCDGIRINNMIRHLLNPSSDMSRVENSMK